MALLSEVSAFIPIILELARFVLVDVSECDAVREIHRVRVPFTKSSFYATGGRFQSIFSTRDPGFHSKRRRLFGPYFTEISLSSFEPIMTNLVRLAVDGIVQESKESGCVDILKWWTLMAMDVIAELSFGESFDMVRSGKKSQFAEDVARAGSILPLRSAFPIILRLGAYFPFIPFFKDIAESRQRILAVQQKRVARFLELVAADNSERSKSLFGALVKKGNAADLSPMDLVVEVQSFITAGTDTTAVTLTYLVWAVCQNPAVQERLVGELRALPESPTHAHMRELPYLDQTIKETLRCYGAAPGALPRDVPAGGANLGGHYIPAGAIVSTQNYSLHRDPVMFPNPDRFDPSRWEEPTKGMTDAFMPFGIGPRGCIGAQLAWMELRLATALFFRAAPNARISAKNGMSQSDMQPEISFLLMPKGHRCLIEV
ncbi:MAG: hypothetical protein Q9169_006453 [Polycauliona sp. 2 TL-2023]